MFWKLPPSIAFFSRNLYENYLNDFFLLVIANIVLETPPLTAFFLERIKWKTTSDDMSLQITPHFINIWVIYASCGPLNYLSGFFGAKKLLPLFLTPNQFMSSQITNTFVKIICRRKKLCNVMFLLIPQDLFVMTSRHKRSNICEVSSQMRLIVVVRVTPKT